jgi:hypothetical protein
MDDDAEFSVDAARRAAEDGRLSDWVLAFLASAGSDNEELAAAFAFRGAAYLGPLLLDFDRLTPMAGPDEDAVVVPVPEAEWEPDVEGMEESVEEGWQPPPLLVTHRDGQFLLEDGNHRFEALRRSGEVRGWVILAFADAAEREVFASGMRAAAQRLPR